MGFVNFMFYFDPQFANIAVILVGYNIACGVCHYIYIYIYAFSRRFYPKRLTVHSGYTCLSVCMSCLVLFVFVNKHYVS